MHKRIILGSNSPRRRELLAGLGLDFSVDTENNFTESIDSGIEPRQLCASMSRGKSHGFHRALEEDEVLITADTIVVIDGKVLGKPHSKEEAVSMLLSLSGRTHEVLTSVCIRDKHREVEFCDSTLVTFLKLSNEEIETYVEKFQPYDKAGAYGVQEWIGYVGISHIDGSFYNVMGLPVHKVWRELQQFLNFSQKDLS